MIPTAHKTPDITLAQRVFDESWGDALRDAFDTPPRYGGRKKPKKPKTPPKTREPFLRTVKRAAHETVKALVRPVMPKPSEEPKRSEEAVSLFDRVLAEGKRPGIRQEFGDAFKTLHRWGSKVVKTAQDWSDRGGALAPEGGSSGASTPSQKAPAVKAKWEAPEAADPKKLPSATSARAEIQRKVKEKQAEKERLHKQQKEKEREERHDRLRSQIQARPRPQVRATPRTPRTPSPRPRIRVLPK